VQFGDSSNPRLNSEGVELLRSSDDEATVPPGCACRPARSYWLRRTEVSYLTPSVLEDELVIRILRKTLLRGAATKQSDSQIYADDRSINIKQINIYEDKNANISSDYCKRYIFIL
jgi:hypothetical protein